MAVAIMTSIKVTPVRRGRRVMAVLPGGAG